MSDLLIIALAKGAGAPRTLGPGDVTYIRERQRTRPCWDDPSIIAAKEEGRAGKEETNHPAPGTRLALLFLPLGDTET